MARFRTHAAALLALVLISGCGGGAAAPATGGGSSPEVASASPSSAPEETPSASETPSEEPSPTPLAGFEDWKAINPWTVEMSVDDDGALRMDLITRALWFDSSRGALLYREITGDFVATATVRTATRSDPTAPLPSNGIVQLGGLMARGDEASENYVFIVVGNDATGPVVETKSTVNSRSTWEGPDWTGSDAELRLCRLGTTFRLYKRPADSDAAWALAAEIDRPDLPEELQVGANIYSDQQPDLTVRWEGLEIRQGDPGNDCPAT